MHELITTAISYPNGDPHIGHAYEAIAADVVARARKRAGTAVRLLTGTDEHGLKIAQKAKSLGLTPKELVDQQADTFRLMNDTLGVEYDRFIRTTDEDHIFRAQILWNKLADKGDLYLDTYKGWYSISDEAYCPEGEIVEADGLKFNQQGNPLTWVEEESWFFRLTRYTDAIKQHIEDNPTFIQPDSRRNEVLGMLASGLSDISVSRTSFDWGIPVPGSSGHVMYVWIDALSNYLTGAHHLGNFHWPAALHIIGKDIIKFHAVYWPAMLMSADLELPRQIFAHGFWLNQGKRMSKTTGNVVDPVAVSQQFGVDQLRYYLLAETTFGQDGDYSPANLKTRVNAELVNSWGNLIQRTCSLIANNMEEWPYLPTGNRALYRVSPEVGEHFRNLRFSQGIAAWLKEVAVLNQLIYNAAPWNAFKEGRRDDAETVLAVVLAAIIALNEEIAPVIPHSAERLRLYLAAELVPPTILFPRIP